MPDCTHDRTLEKFLLMRSIKGINLQSLRKLDCAVPQHAFLLFGLYQKQHKFGKEKSTDEEISRSQE